jgi:hypothetical protein
LAQLTTRPNTRVAVQDVQDVRNLFGGYEESGVDGALKDKIFILVFRVRTEIPSLL